MSTPKLDQLLATAASLEASDLHLVAGVPPAFRVNGEIILGRKLFDSFRYKFDFPASSVASAEIPMVFERFLRPGSYRMVVKVEDLNSSKVYRAERDIEVPVVATTARLPEDSEDRRILEEAAAALGEDRTTLQIVEPQGTMQTGMVRFDTLTTGSIAEVRFELDGAPLFRKKGAPYSVELDLGRVPRAHVLRVTAHDPMASRAITNQVNKMVAFRATGPACQ